MCTIYDVKSVAISARAVASVLHPPLLFALEASSTSGPLPSKICRLPVKQISDSWSYGPSSPCANKFTSSWDPVNGSAYSPGGPTMRVVPQQRDTPADIDRRRCTMAFAPEMVTSEEDVSPERIRKPSWNPSGAKGSVTA